MAMERVCNHCGAKDELTPFGMLLQDRSDRQNYMYIWGDEDECEEFDWCPACKEKGLAAIKKWLTRHIRKPRKAKGETG